MSQQFPNPQFPSPSGGGGQSPYQTQVPFGNPAFGAPPPKKKGMSVGAILGIVFAVLGVVVLACGGFAFYAIRQVAVDSEELVTKNTNDGVASLQVPKNWMPLTGANANPEASLQMGNLFAETYALVLSESKAEVSGVMGGGLGGENVTLDAYSDLIINNMVSTNPGFSGTPKASTSLNGMPAYSFKVSGSVDGNPVVFIGMVTEGKRHFHQILCWTLQSRETKNIPKLESVMQSFREL